MYLSVESLENDVFNKIEQGDYNGALEILIDFVYQVVYTSKRATATVFGSERLDWLCLSIGEAVASLNPVTSEEKMSDVDVVIIASHFDRYGGHTLVVEDLIRAQPEKKYLILLTNLLNATDKDSMHKRFGSLSEVRVAPSGNALEKLRWLLMQLNAIKPGHIFLFNHHQDAPAIAAMQPGVRSKVFFYHHADHNLCLGVHLPGAIHIDCHNIGYYNCRLHEKLKDNLYLPLSVDDRGARPGNLEFMRDGLLRTCSCGTHIKFDPLYTYPYVELISKRLALFAGVHFHIGGLPDGVLESIRRQLALDGVDTNRFIHIPWVDSLWSALIKHEIDLYISSFPIGGGRASIEAMGAGIPLLVHVGSLSRFHGAADIVYPEAFSWKDPAEFEQCLSSLSPQTLKEHSKSARTYYENNHTPQLMAGELVNICRGEGKLIPPRVRPYSPDYLLRHLQLTLFEMQPVIERERQIAVLNQVVAARDSEIASMLSSTSWRITRPLRFGMKQLRRVLPLLNRIRRQIPVS
ncbi:MAG TPA: hypothetical protein VLD55_06595 [Candidatus Sulfobium mesophilum]|nr:hypothetical protein [Candidatus Sulfobium mesophilum]